MQIWALGVCLYECCTQRHPFEADNQGALIMKILKGRYPPVTGYSAELTDVIKACLALVSGWGAGGETSMWLQPDSLPAVRSLPGGGRCAAASQSH